MPFPIEQPWAQGREEVETEEKEQEEDSVRLEGRKDGWLDGWREGGWAEREWRGANLEPLTNFKPRFILSFPLPLCILGFSF